MKNPSFPHVFAAATNPSAPPLVLLHGTGGDEHDLVPLARTLSPGSAVLSPRGKVSEHGANRFFARLAEGIFEPAEVTQRTHELADFIAAASAQYGLDAKKLIAVGLSNGANVAATILQLRPGVIGGAVLFRPMVVLDQPAVPNSLTGQRVLILSGSHDPIVPNSEPPRLAALLRHGGAEVALHTSAASHGLVAADLAVGARYFSAS
jgi:predicted esterase